MVLTVRFDLFLLLQPEILVHLPAEIVGIVCDVVPNAADICC